MAVFCVENTTGSSGSIDEIYLVVYLENGQCVYFILNDDNKIIFNEK